MEISLDALPDDTAALRAIILAQHRQIAGIAAANRAYEALIQALKITIARLKKQKHGASSEKIEREIEQLELALENLETARAAADTAPETPEEVEDEAANPATLEERVPPRRRGKPRISEDAPRETIVLDPGERCPDCGGVLRLVGEDVAEILDFIAAKLKVVDIHRPKKSCRDCERMVQTPAPSRPVPRGMAGPSLLAHILVSKYDDHLPLYRQGEFRPHGRGHSPLDAHRLVRPGRGRAPPAGRHRSGRGDGLRQAPRRRHPHSRARPEEEADRRP